MNKILVSVKIAAIEKRFDIWIPKESLIKDVILLISAAIERYSDETYQLDSKAVLCREDGCIYDLNKTVRGAGIQNGDLLVLI